MALEASQMTPSLTLPQPKSLLNDPEGGPYARMRPQIRPIDDLPRQVAHQLIVKNRDLANVRRGGGVPRRARPYGGQKMAFSMSKEGTRGPKFAIKEELVGELADPETLEGTP